MKKDPSLWIWSGAVLGLFLLGAWTLSGRPPTEPPPVVGEAFVLTSTSAPPPVIQFSEPASLAGLQNSNAPSGLDPNRPWVAGEKWSLDRRRAAGLATPEGYDPLVVPVPIKSDWLFKEEGSESGWGWLYDEASRLWPAAPARDGAARWSRAARDALGEPGDLRGPRGRPSEDWLP